MSRTNDLYQDELESAGIEIERLEAENKRYREALEDICKHRLAFAIEYNHTNGTNTGDTIFQIAQAALKDNK